MKIYVTHGTGFDYHKELYKPLRNSDLDNHFNIILPHEKSKEQFNSKKELQSCQIVVAEVSEASTGVGIELGWANLYNCTIICMYKKGCMSSRSLAEVSKVFVQYDSAVEDDFIDRLQTLLGNMGLYKAV